MSLIETQIATAEGRANFDVAAAIAAARDKLPQDMSSDRDVRARKDFLRDSMGDTREAKEMYERVLLGNELQPINYLERGEIAARAVSRIAIRTPSGERGWGTGFLIAPQVLITNNHVLSNAATAAGSKAEFSYEVSLADQDTGPIVFDLQPERLFYTSVPLDFTVVAVRERSTDGKTSLGEFGFLPLLDIRGKAIEGEWLTIVQHPAGERKQLCVRENRLIKREADKLLYSADTQPGSSGSPAFNNDWFVVALHHAGVPQEVDGEIQTVDGSKYIRGVTKDAQIKWIANEGIRASRIAQTLKTVEAQHALLQPLFNATPASARIVRRSWGAQVSNPKTSFSKAFSVMTDSRTVNVPLEIRLQVQADGSVTVVGAGAPGATEASFVVEEKAGAKKPSANFDAPFDDDYASREGFNTDFLGAGAKRVGLPTLSKALQAVAVPLLRDDADGKAAKAQDYVLKYNNYSVVMHTERRLAIYSAANVSFGQRYDMGRPKDVWRRDPRILTKYQLENWYYAANKFDRGHLTRREDLEFGKTPVVALQSAADTCHWTNCTPQHEKFNQNKEIWQGIERHVLETSILGGHFSAQIITGPVFNDGDPEYKNIPYPVQFWKVVAALTDEGNLFATAFLASQEEVIDQHGIEAAIPFGAYKTFQVKITDIERIADVKFPCGADGTTPLSKYDPLEMNPPKRRLRGVRATEAAAMRDFGHYREIRELEDIHLELKKSK